MQSARSFCLTKYAKLHKVYSETEDVLHFLVDCAVFIMDWLETAVYCMLVLLGDKLPWLVVEIREDHITNQKSHATCMKKKHST